MRQRAVARPRRPRCPQGSNEPRGFTLAGWRALVQGSLAAGLVDLADGVPQAFDPVRLVHADQPYAPGQRVAPAPGDTARHQRVQDRAFGHPEPGHHRHAEGGENPGLVPALRAPGDLAADLPPLLPGDPHPPPPGSLPDALPPRSDSTPPAPL